MTTYSSSPFNSSTTTNPAHLCCLQVSSFSCAVLSLLLCAMGRRLPYTMCLFGFNIDCRSGTSWDTCLRRQTFCAEGPRKGSAEGNRFPLKASWNKSHGSNGLWTRFEGDGCVSPVLLRGPHWHHHSLCRSLGCSVRAAGRSCWMPPGIKCLKGIAIAWAFVLGFGFLGKGGWGEFVRLFGLQFGSGFSQVSRIEPLGRR